MAIPLLYLKDAKVTFGGNPLFLGISLQIMQGDKICLVGRNGSGKSTLLKVIANEIELDGGERFIQPGVTIGYLPQSVTYKPGQTVRDYVLDGLETHNADEVEDQRYRADMVISPLNLKPDAPMEKLSGGKLRRAGLARSLVSNPDILLLDEPTNHLDLSSIEWLENYLAQYKGGLVCISHDRTFLTNISSKTFWLDRGLMRTSEKGYSNFEAWSEEVMEAEQKALERMGKKLEAENHWLAYGVTARRKRNQRRLGDLIALRSKLKSDNSHFRSLSATVKLPPLTPEQSSKMVAEIKELSKYFTDVDPPKLMIKNFSTRILRGDRIGIIGRNGAGKTTFLKLLLKQLEPTSGHIRMGKNLVISYFDQKRETLDPNKTVWQTLCPEGGDSVMVRGESRHVVGYLRDFLFDADQVRSPVGALSGGECNRLLLAKELADPGNVLILDEPTNDLDMDSLDVLQEVLSDYEGTLLIVSHDRDFIDRLVTKTIVFEGGGEVQEYIGGYSDYLAQKKEEIKAVKKAAQAAEKPAQEKQASGSTKMSYKFKRELELLPERIATLEKEIIDLETLMHDPELYTKDAARFDKASRDLVAKKQELEEAEHRWLELEEMKGALEG